MQPAFNSEKNGYDMREVDDFIDRLQKENDALKEAVAELEAQMAELESYKGDIVQTMKNIKKIEEETRQKADEFVKKAKKKVDDIVNNAQLKTNTPTKPDRKSIEDAYATVNKMIGL